MRLSLPALWAIVAVVLPVAVVQSRLSTVDLAYQVRAGDLMLRTQALIRTDSFTFTAVRRPWLDQQWGAQVLFAFAHRAGGWAALAAVRAALVAVVFGLVYFACRAAGSNERRAAGLTLASFALSAAGLSLRPQLLAMAMFGAVLWAIASRRRRPWALWLVPLLVALWANIHGSFFLGPLMVGLAWLQDRKDRSRAANRTLAVAIAALAATLLNPFGVRVWSYVVDISTNPAVRHLAGEWQRPSLGTYTGAMFFLSGLAVAAVLGRRRAPWPTLLSAGILFAIGVVAVRGVFWWAMAAPVLLSEALGPSRARERAELPPSILNTGIALFLVGLTIAFSPAWRGGNANSFLTFAPPGITARLGPLLGPADRMFNPQRWGSWFEQALPEDPVFVDSRLEVFPASVWSDYQVVSKGDLGWQQVLDRWQIGFVVANRQDQAGLIAAISNEPGWILIYRDADGSIFERAALTPGSSS